MKKHVRVFQDEDFENQNCVLVLKKSGVNLDDLIYLDPSDYYSCTSAMEVDGVLAACELSQGLSKSGTPYFYPNTTYVHPNYRNKGLGKLLYRTCLSTIKELGYNKEDVEFRMHDATPYGVTSKSAKNIYHSLRKKGYIKRIRAGRYSIIRWPRPHFKEIEQLI